ncbi:MAG: hypothetical protein CM1200mP26_07930 [Acidimicrobiales bacterium]|nr:MAG: hypothetical protein CM1200mP26_07930 [Acidimicrobiales bacterium]
MNEIQHLIDGRSVASTSGNVGPVFDPATGQQTGTVALASVAEVDAAVISARNAFDGWGEVSLPSPHQVDARVPQPVGDQRRRGGGTFIGRARQGAGRRPW